MKNWESVCDLKLCNMSMNDSDERPKEYLKFKNHDSDSQFPFVKRCIFPDISFLSLREELERFPFQNTEEQPKKIRHNLGLPINFSVSNSFSEDFSHRQISLSNNSNSTIDLEGWFTSSSDASKTKNEKFYF